MLPSLKVINEVWVTTPLPNKSPVKSSKIDVLFLIDQYRMVPCGTHVVLIVTGYVVPSFIMLSATLYGAANAYVGWLLLVSKILTVALHASSYVNVPSRLSLKILTLTVNSSEPSVKLSFEMGKLMVVVYGVVLVSISIVPLVNVPVAKSAPVVKPVVVHCKLARYTLVAVKVKVTVVPSLAVVGPVRLYVSIRRVAGITCGTISN